MKKTTTYLLSFLFLFTLTTCKKYPENTLWFKNIKKIKFFDNVKFTSFTVNGFDSLASLKNCFTNQNSEIVRIEQGWDEHYDAYVPTLFFNDGIYANNTMKFFYGYSKNKKKINILFYLNYSVSFNVQLLKKSLFVEENTEWDIIKLDPKGSRKIRTIINGNTYEMQFDQA